MISVKILSLFLLTSLLLGSMSYADAESLKNLSRAVSSASVSNDNNGGGSPGVPRAS